MAYFNRLTGDPAGTAMDLGTRVARTGIAQWVSDKLFSEENIDMVYPDMLKEYIEVPTIKKALDFAFLWEVNIS